MCGRFYLDVANEKLKAHYQLRQVPNLVARYNIAPTQDIPVVRQSEQGRELVMLHWGLIPSWAREEKSHYSMINARAETVASKPAFRSAFRKRRCLIPASGFYEWQSQAKHKQPYAIAMQDGELFSMAGVWGHWEGDDGKIIESCSIIVTNANKVLRPIHERMPVIIAPGDYEKWLTSRGVEIDNLTPLLLPYPSTGMRVYPVSRRMNNPVFDEPSCIEPVQ
jgi:putative SOS response-associated peptidase YedK